MTSAAQPMPAEHVDARTIVGGGIKLGILTGAGVTAFALISRPIGGTVEVITQSVLILVGGVLFSYLPARWVQPRSTDGIGWTALLGLVGALVFTVIDAAVLRPVELYHWTWDAIGGGSGFWYIPVWWMGSALLSWLGGWVLSNYAGDAVQPVSFVPRGIQTAVMAIVLFAVLVLTGAVPFHSAGMALAFVLALAVHVPLSAAMNRR